MEISVKPQLDSLLLQTTECHTKAYYYLKPNVASTDGEMLDLVFLIWFCPGNSGSWTSSILYKEQSILYTSLNFTTYKERVTSLLLQ